MTLEHHLTRSEAETEAVGRALASHLSRGDVVLLRGELGAGKTAFVRGLAAGLGVPADEVSSPTFAILQRYAGPLPLYHADLYRLTTGEVGELGLEDVAADGVLAVEWAERLDESTMPLDPVRVDLTVAGEVDREIRIARTPRTMG